MLCKSLTGNNVSIILHKENVYMCRLLRGFTIHYRVPRHYTSEQGRPRLYHKEEEITVSLLFKVQT